MTLALDINPLLYASDTDSPFHPAAAAALTELANGSELVYLFWPVAVGYVRLGTGSGIAHVALTLDEAMGNVDRLLALPHFRTSAENSDFWSLFCRAAAEAQARSKLISDVHLVALMRQHGVRRILTHDRDFRKFDDIKVIDPFA